MLTTLAVLGSIGALAQVSNLIWLGIVFFIIAIVAYVVGAQGVAGMSAGIGRTIMFVALILAVILLVAGFIPR